MQNLLKIIFASLLINSVAFSQNSINFNFKNLALDTVNNELTIAVEIENSSDEAFVLGDQNVRFYYSSESMELIPSMITSTLPTEYYSEIEMVEHITEYNASIGVLDYDNNLGFVNYNVYLEDLPYGGVTITAGQKLTIATLTFLIKDYTSTSQLTAARQSLTGDYASAYVAITEWRNDSTFELLDIETYTDVSYTQKKTYKKENMSIGDVQVGPNPTSDFIRISNISEDSHVIIRNITGAVMYKEAAIKNVDQDINIAGYQSGTYIVTINNGVSMTTKKIAVTK